jgi:hypothetical protein
VDLPGSGKVAGFCEYVDEPLGYGATELVTYGRKLRDHFSARFAEPEMNVVRNIITFTIYFY